MPNQSNAAYDLSLFEPKPPDRETGHGEEEHRKRNTAAANRANRLHAAIRPIQAVRWAAAAVVCLVAIGSIMVCNVQNTKLNDQVAEMQQKLAAAQADEVRLNMEQQSRASLSNVENYATTKLGMQKATTYQVNYIRINSKDKVVVQKSEENFLSRVYNWILEYL